MKSENEKFCTECGALINRKAEICPKCGVRQTNTSFFTVSEQSNRWIACLLLCWFLGILGVHRFYTGHKIIGIIQLLTLGGFGIWMLIDFIMILTGNFKDAEGNPIKSS